VHSLQVLRQGDWKLIEEGARYYNWDNQPLQLYNIRQDPSEKRNLAANEPQIVARLRARLASQKPLARTPEPVEPIPGFPPAVYGEEENAQHGDEVRRQLAAQGIAGRRERKGRKKGKDRR
jgi:hypothetical protein